MKFDDDIITADDIHDLHRETNSILPVNILVAAIVFLVSSLNVYAVIYLNFPIFFGVVVHILTFIVIAAFSSFLIRRGLDSRFMLLLTVTSLALGPFGAAGTIIANIMTALHLRFAQSFGEWFASIFPSLIMTKPEIVYDDIYMGRDLSSHKYSVTSFLDIILTGSESQKREALTKMTMMFDPSFSEAFRRALRDNSNMIRVQAAACISRIEENFLKKIKLLNSARNRSPKDHRLLLLSAKLFDNYAFTGLLDDEREHMNRKLALDYYMQYIKNHPNDVEARLAVGRIMVRSGDFDRAAEWFQRCVESRFINSSILSWYAECLFRLGRYNELRGICSANYAAVTDNLAPDSGISGSFRLWSGAPANYATEFQSGTVDLQKTPKLNKGAA